MQYLLLLLIATAMKKTCSLKKGSSWKLKWSTEEVAEMSVPSCAHSKGRVPPPPALPVPCFAHWLQLASTLHIVDLRHQISCALLPRNYMSFTAALHLDFVLKPSVLHLATAVVFPSSSGRGKTRHGCFERTEVELLHWGSGNKHWRQRCIFHTLF